jgi:CheY-like chemotaxis protein
MRGALRPYDHQLMTRTVLIVDDHAPFRALDRALLQLEGFVVVGEAADAPHTLEEAAKLAGCPRSTFATWTHGYGRRSRGADRPACH